MQYAFRSRTYNKKHKVQEMEFDIGPGAPLYISTALLFIHCVDRVGHMVLRPKSNAMFKFMKRNTTYGKT